MTNLFLRRSFARLKQLMPKRSEKYFRKWRARDFSAPAPQAVKEAVLLSKAVPDAPWIETGTYLGHKTKFLALNFPHVATIEPSPELFKNAQSVLSKWPNIETKFGISETVLPELLADASGDLNFWLDGHCSFGNTFLGPNHTPIRQELDLIADHLVHLGSVSIFVDDVRLFGTEEGYPRTEFLIEFAVGKNFRWSIEHDIFIATNQ